MPRRATPLTPLGSPAGRCRGDRLTRQATGPFAGKSAEARTAAPRQRVATAPAVVALVLAGMLAGPVTAQSVQQSVDAGKRQSQPSLARDLGPTAQNPGVPPGPEGATAAGAAAPVVPNTDRPGIVVSRTLTAPGVPLGVDNTAAPGLGTSRSRATTLAIPPTGWITRADAARQPNLAAVFDQVDTNRDGMVSPSELSAWQRRTGRPMP